MRRRVRPRGFTLIELLIVVMVIGILAATAMPQYARVVEKSRVAEALAALNVLRGSQQRYLNKYGTYCLGPVATCGLDTTVPPLKYFGAWPNMTAGAGSPSWKITITRNQNTAYYGAYVLTYDMENNAYPALTCSNGPCTNDLLPTIK